MFKKKSKDEIFFDLFYEISDLTCTAAKKLNDLMKNYENVGEKIKAIEDIEHACDQKVHDIVRLLNKSFITPIDQEDINELAKKIDNIIDAIEDTAYRFQMFKIQSITSEAVALSDLVVQCTEELKNIMTELRNMKTSKTLVMKVIEVNRIENEGDDIYRKAMMSLFSNGMETIDVIKWKEIYDFIENSIDACEDVANIVEGIVMKNA